MDSISLDELRNYVINLCKNNEYVCDKNHDDDKDLNIKQLSVDGEIIELCFRSDWGQCYRGVFFKEKQYLYCNSENKEINDIINSIYETNRFDNFLESKIHQHQHDYYILKLIENEYVVYHFYGDEDDDYLEIHENHYISKGDSYFYNYTYLFEIVREYVRIVNIHNIKLAINSNDNDNDNDNDNNIYDGEELN